MTGAGEAGESSMSATSAVRIQFPEGLRVLAVDDDQTCLHIVGRMLERCMYQVTKCRSGKEALSLLREDSSRFDIVLSDLHLSDINGLKLLEIMAFEMDMPVVVMSSDEKRETIMKGVIHGACEYMVKPVRMDAVELLWQHVIRKRRNDQRNDQLKDMEQAMEDELVVEEGEERRSMKKKEKRRKHKKEDQDDEGGESSDHINIALSTSTSAVKKPRMVWTPSLHQQFEAAVNKLGYSRAVPKKIVEQMNLPGLTRENVASHLQKFRQHRRRQSKISQRRLQGLTMGGASTYSMVSVDQRNLLDYGMVGQQQPSSYTYGDMGFQISEGINSRFLNLPSANAMMKMDQTPYGLPMLNEISGQGHHQQFGDQFHPFSNQVLSDDIEAQAFRAVGDNSMQGINAATCYPLASSPMVDFSEDHSHGFPLEAAPGMNAIYGNACSVGQEIVSLGEGYGFRNPENSFRINPVSFWSLGYEGFSFGEHFQQEFMSQKF